MYRWVFYANMKFLSWPASCPVAIFRSVMGHLELEKKNCRETVILYTLCNPKHTFRNQKRMSGMYCHTQKLVHVVIQINVVFLK